MCGEHRREQLALLKKLLKSRKKVICISTQLIEAGVDISFACVVRAMAGLDSILQAAGRCNRNGEAPELQPVYTYPIQNERGIEKLRDIQIGKEITQKIIRENPDADYLDEHILNEFYQYYFYMRVGEMDYHTKDGATVYDMLSCNDNGRGNYKNRTGQAYSNCLAQAFDKVGKHFFVIPDLTRTVVVYHGESEKLLDAFKTADMGEKIKLLHLLQDYTVGLFDYEFGNLEKARAISLFDEEFGIYVLNREYYSQEYGVNKNAEMPNHVV